MPPGSRPTTVDVDLRRAACPAGLGRASERRPARGSSRSARSPGARRRAAPCRRSPRTTAVRSRGRRTTNVVSRRFLIRSGASVERLVGLLVRGADVALADRDATVGDVVVRRGRRSTGSGRRPCRCGVTSPMNWCWNSSVVGHADEQRGRDRPELAERGRGCSSRYARVGVLPLQALLDVGVLVDDPRLERREVGRGRGREVRTRASPRTSAEPAHRARCRSRSRG